MTFIDRYPKGLNDARDGRSARVAHIDALIYRLIYTRQAVPGLPEQVTVGDVSIHFAEGPVLSQVTEIRQRPGFPFIFDKHLNHEVPVGESDLLTLCEIEIDPPDDLATAMAECRAQSERALGLLCTTLDERLAGVEVAEDMLLLEEGEAVAVADLHSDVRPFMPFDIVDADRDALTSLEGVDLDSRAAEAASLYLRGAREGRTPVGLLLLWLAIDALVGARKTQKGAVAVALARLGFDHQWLRLPLGRLVGVRGDVAHGRTVERELLHNAWHDSEGIARALVRAASGTPAGWPTLPTASAFPLPLGRRIAEAETSWQVEWHEEGLPLPDPEVKPTGFPRFDAALGGHAEWITVVGTEDAETIGRLHFWAFDAVVALDVAFDPFTIEVDSSSQIPPEFEIGVNQERILIAPELATPADDEGEVRLAYFIVQFLAQMQVMRTGLMSDGFGAFLIELAGNWAAYREWVGNKEMPPDALTRQSMRGLSLKDLGGIVGVALAGDQQAAEELADWLEDERVDSDLREAVGGVATALAAPAEFSDVLGFVAEVVDAAQTQDDTPPGSP